MARLDAAMQVLGDAIFGALREQALAGGHLARGMLLPGNIDLAHRPIVRNKNGSISTVRSISVGVNGRTFLLPTVVGDRVVSNRQAIRHFERTGEHLGVFSNWRDADRYAARLHRQQARRYLPQANSPVFGPVRPVRP